MTRYRIINRWSIFWIEQKFLWFWIRTETSRMSYHKTFDAAKSRLEDMQKNMADKGRVVWQS